MSTFSEKKPVVGIISDARHDIIIHTLQMFY